MRKFSLKFFALSIPLMMLFSCAGGQNSSPIMAEGTPPAIIPAPKALSWGENMYRIPEQNTICFTQGGETAASWLEELLSNASVAVELSEGENCGNWKIIKNADLKEELGEEGYRLDITDTGVTIGSATDAGLFYGIQTLRQFFPAELEQGKVSESDLLLRQAAIEDAPEYGWRGTMVDVARSFFNLDYLKKHVDRMVLYKLNRLHLHLTDDQGWRIEIKGWPKLAENGGKSTVKNGRTGFLTQDEYKELQAYAAARNIIIIPEVDMPGHIYAALNAYPELNCPGLSNITPRRATPPEHYDGVQVGWSKLCLENPDIYDFVTDVVKELVEITTGPYIHIGGDEIEDPRYEEFVVKAVDIVKDHGKTPIGWEEVTKAEVDPSLISQQWHGRVESKVDVKIIHSICSQFYLDHANVPGQEHTNNWCKEDGVSLEEVYSFSSDNPNVLGVEAAVWSEYVITDEMMDDRFWPRGVAVAEVAWSSKVNRDFEDFKVRLEEHAVRLNQMGVHYFPTPGIDWKEENRAAEPASLFAGFKPE